MRKKLDQIGSLRSGFQLREAVRPDREGRETLIQLAHVRPDGTVATADLVRMDVDASAGRLEEFRAAQGDVLLRSRGANYGAAVVPPDCPAGAIVVTPLYMLKLLPEAPVIPEYVAWYVNREEIQAELAAEARGSHIPTVSIRIFAALELPVPPLDVQLRIAAADALLRQEWTLTQELLARRTAFIRASLDTLIARYDRAPKKD